MTFNFAEFQDDFRGGRISPERAENLALELRDKSDETLERAADIAGKYKAGEQPEDKDARRIARLENESAEHLRHAEKIDAFLRLPQGRKAGTGGDPNHRIVVRPSGAEAPDKTGRLARSGIVGAQAKYAKLFAAHAAEAFNVIGKPADAGAYLSAVLTGKQIDAFRFTNTAVESVGSEGGFRVPEPLIAAIWDDAIASGNFLSRATTYPMTAPTATISTPDWEMRTSGVIGGLLGVWLSEAQEGSEDKTLFRNVTLHTHKVAIFSQISSELAEDAINVESDIQTNMQKSTGYTVDHACLYGTGVKQPLGVFNSPALITVAAEGSQTADTLTALNIAKMVARMDPASITKAEWFVSPTLLPELFRLNFQGRTDAGAAVADTVVSAQPLFQSMGDGRYSLFGRPLHLVELMATKGDLGDILFADWSRYAVGIRRGARIERNVAPGWTKDAIDYRITMRVAGLPMNSKPITPQNGDTFSPFVTLAAR